MTITQLTHPITTLQKVTILESSTLEKGCDELKVQTEMMEEADSNNELYPTAVNGLSLFRARALSHCQLEAIHFPVQFSFCHSALCPSVQRRVVMWRCITSSILSGGGVVRSQITYWAYHVSLCALPGAAVRVGRTGRRRKKRRTTTHTLTHAREHTQRGTNT